MHLNLHFLRNMKDFCFCTWLQVTVLFGLLLFYGTLTIVGYLNAKSYFFTYILNISFINTFVDTLLNDQTALFLKIQFSQM